MSSIICKVIYGCEVPQITQVREFLHPPVDREEACGYHEQYDQHENKHWWGVKLTHYDEGISDINITPSWYTPREAVDAAWEALPPDIQALLDKPKVRLLLALD